MLRDMYVPNGFTNEDVRRAANDLPDPHRFYLSSGNEECAIVVPEYPASDYVKPTKSFLEDRSRHNCTAMRILYFRLYRIFDWKTDRTVYAWACSGSNQHVS